MAKRKIRPVARLSLGGAIVGGFVGIFAGAIGGTLIGAWRGNVSLGLDGAILVGLILASAGAVYGAVLGCASVPDNPPVEKEDTERIPEMADRP